MSPSRVRVWSARGVRALVLTLGAGCIEAPALRELPEAPQVRAVESSTQDLDALARLPSLRVRFDRPMRWPAAGAVMLVTGAASDALRSDAWDGVLSATNAARVVPSRLALDARDERTLTLDAEVALLPDTAATLLITRLALTDDGASLERADAGPARAMAIPVTVAPARRCGALARLEPVALGDAPEDTARVYVRFDRPVRVEPGAPVATLARDDGAAVPTRASLDCIDSDAMARCAVLEPTALLVPQTVYRARFGRLRARNGAPVEALITAFVTGSRRVAPRVRFVAGVACAGDEREANGLCVRANDRWIELRAATDLAALVRITAVPLDGGAARNALSASGTVHTARVFVDRAETAYALTVDALGSDGRAHERRVLALVKTPRALPRVRITEVLARPRSGSAQEYVELLNDGPGTASLGGLTLAQGASRVVLPAVALAPGARALVVGAAFDPRGDARAGDPAVAPGAVVVRLSGSVAGGGLRDTGSDVRLTDAEGRVLSYVPGADPARRPREGVGLVRAEMDLADEDPAAWSYDSGNSCSPGAPDRLR